MSSPQQKSSSNNKKIIPGKNDFWFLPLGGANEIGMNLNAFGTNGQWLIVDLGVTFFDRYGIEIITPDPSFLIDHQDKIEGLVLTHAHEDHIGAIPYLWPYLKCPLYATPFTMEIIRQKISDKPWRDQVKLIEIPLSSSFKVGDFDLEFITLTHSILEPNALRIETKHGVVLHSGDWKVDPHPLVGDVTDSNRLIQIGDEGVLALICDSTNVFNEGCAGSEQSVRDELTTLIGQYSENRITVACFASNLARVETIVKAADIHGRKVALVGRSLHKMVQAAKQCGYLKDMPELISDVEAMKLPHEKVCFIATGSQGEYRAALARMASGSHPVVELCDNDVVLFSSRMIPGNEKNISALQNMLIHQGVTVITAAEENIHVSGHPARDELRQMYEWVRPEVLIPVHGDARHLDEHARFGFECGIDNVVVPENGSLIQLCKNDVKEIDLVKAGRWVHDGNRMVPMNSPVIKERQKISNEGIICATIVIDNDGDFLQEPNFMIRGLCDSKDEHDFITKEVYKAFKKTLATRFKSDDAMKTALEDVMRKTVKTCIQKKPVVAVHIILASF